MENWLQTVECCSGPRRGDRECTTGNCMRCKGSIQEMMVLRAKYMS